MGFVDKIKNALFEVEYVEVDTKDDKKEKARERLREKEEKAREQEQIKQEQPIAKKVILSNHRNNKKEIDIFDDNNDDIRDIREHRSVEQDEIIEQKPQVVVEKPIVKNHNDFKFMDDKDFTIDDYYTAPKVTSSAKYDDIYDENDYKPIEDTPKQDERVIYKQEPQVKAPYGIDKSNENLVPEYGRAYEKKEEKTGFKPSPIISPIYGVLDKNYRKEDVKEKKSTKSVSSSYSRSNVNVDEIRNKAYGMAEATARNSRKKIEENTIVEDEEDDTNLLVDLTKENDKPSIKEVTMGDAMEYYNDLGLEYNVDYMDAAKQSRTGRRVKDTYEDEPEMFSIQDNDIEEQPKQRATRLDTVEEKPPVVKSSIDVESDDNLFDLIDSMYDEK